MSDVSSRVRAGPGNVGVGPSSRRWLRVEVPTQGFCPEEVFSGHWKRQAYGLRGEMLPEAHRVSGTLGGRHYREDGLDRFIAQTEAQTVIRSILGFHRDEEGDWVAELSCFHNQHIRHRPPFQDRPWVLDPAAREARVDIGIDCPLCDRAEFPVGLTLVGRAGPWDQDSLLTALQKIHRTPEGRWGRLCVHEGGVDF